MGNVTCTIILKSILRISDISLVFHNYSLGIGLSLRNCKPERNRNLEENIFIRPWERGVWGMWTTPSYELSFLVLLTPSRTRTRAVVHERCTLRWCPAQNSILKCLKIAVTMYGFNFDIKF